MADCIESAESVDGPICPNCHNQEEAADCMEDSEMSCNSCGEEFGYTVAVSYSWCSYLPEIGKRPGIF